MAKQVSKEIYIRNLSDQDNEMLEKVRALTGHASNSQALLKAGYAVIFQDNKIDEQRRYIAELEGKLNRYEHNVKDLFIAQDNLRKLSNSKL